MKRIFLFISVMLSLASIGQVATPLLMTNPNGYAIDTITNAGSEGPYFKSSNPQKNKITITMEVTKISGTVAGTMVLQGSNHPTYDATTFATIKNWGIDSSVTATNATNTYNFNDYSGGFVFYRVLWTGSGTMSASYKAYANKTTY